MTEAPIDPVGELGARAAHVATTGVQLVEVWMQTQAWRRPQMEAEVRTVEGLVRAEGLAERARSMSVLAPAATDGRRWARTAKPGELYRTWAVGVAAGSEPVVAVVEDELRRRAPDTMARYAAARAAGTARVEAMRNLIVDLENEVSGVRVAGPPPHPSRSRPAGEASTAPAQTVHSTVHSRSAGSGAAESAATQAAAWAAGTGRRYRAQGQTPTVHDPSSRRRGVTSTRTR